MNIVKCRSIFELTKILTTEVIEPMKNLICHMLMRRHPIREFRFATWEVRSTLFPNLQKRLVSFKDFYFSI